MSCKCQDKQKRIDTPCEDKKEESFRIAFLNESKKSSRFSAERDELMKRLIELDRAAKNQVKELDNKLSQLESYAELAISKLPEDIQKAFVHTHGYPPVRVRISFN